MEHSVVDHNNNEMNMTGKELKSHQDITFDEKDQMAVLAPSSSKNHHAHSAARRKRGTKSAATREIQYKQTDVFRNTIGSFPKVDHFLNKPINKAANNNRGASKSITHHQDESAFGCK